MFAAYTTKSSSRKRSTSREKSPRGIIEGIRGYSCTLYKDYLVFFGGFYNGRAIQDVSVYNLKEERIERPAQERKNLACPKFGHSACSFEEESMILFFGGEDGERTSRYEDKHANPTLIIEQREDGLSWYLRYGIEGGSLPSPTSNLYQRKLYVHQADESNGNFGTLRSYDIKEDKWRDYHGVNGDLRLNAPSNKSIWIKNKLYLFTQNVDQQLRPMAWGSEFIEDVYVISINDEDKRSPQWEKISSGDQVPGMLGNISMTETNGVIYIFGSNYQEGRPTPVLWAFDTNEEKWKKVQDIGSLTASPNQRAVVYEGRLLIINWNLAEELVEIQYQDLEHVNMISSSPNGKDICRDKPENLVSDIKNLYDGRLFHDVVFEVEGEEIPAHKAILAYRSDYFMKMFTSGMSESHSAKISIPNIKSQIFKALLQYIYCNEIELDEQLALDLIPVVDEYLMKGLKELCEKYLCKQLRKENVVDMLIVADRHEIDELKKACFKFILKNLGNIDENEEMMKLTKSLFIELLKFNTPGLQQKSNTKSEKQEEEKSNNNGRNAKADKKSTSYSKGADFAYAYGMAPAKKSASKGRKATSRSRSTSRSPPRPILTKGVASKK